MTEDELSFLMVYKWRSGESVLYTDRATDLDELESAWLGFLCTESGTGQNSFGWEL